MATAYNVHNDMYRALQADRTVLLDPGNGGTVNITPTQNGIVTLSTAGTASLQTASTVPLGTSILVLTQAAITVESLLVMADGDAAEFRVIKDSAGANAWAVAWSASTTGNIVDLNGGADALILDADGDTTLSAPTNDQIDVEIGGADDFTFTANSFNVLAGSTIVVADDTEISYGDGSDTVVGWQTGDTDNHTMVIGLGDSNQSLHITDKAAIGTDWNVAAETHPTVFVHSNTTPATDYLRIGDHDGTTAYIDVVGGTQLDFQIAGATAANVQAGRIEIGDAADTSDNRLLIFDGGSENPGLLILYDHTGTPHFLWVDNTGDLRIGTAAPTDEDADGTIVGTQT